MKILVLFAMRFVVGLITGSKWICSLIISFCLTPFIHFIEKYFFADWDFLMFLGVLIIGDTILGFIVHYKSKTISSNGFAKFFTKLLIYFSVLILTHVLTHYKINGVPCITFAWITQLIYTAVIIRECISILENVALINPTIIPGWITTRLKKFESES
jgi:phage-related holin